jgi:hypothetical protein
MPAVAQLHVEMNADAAAATEEDSRAIGRKPRPVGGKEQVGAELVT